MLNMALVVKFFELFPLAMMRLWGTVPEKPHRTFGCFGKKPKGIAVSKSGEHLIVANEESSEVVVLTMDGELVRRIKVYEPLGVAVDVNGNIWVCEPASRLKVFTEQGELIRTISLDKNPLAVAFLSNGNAVVSTTTRQVVTVTPDGQQVGIFNAYDTKQLAKHPLCDIKVSPNDEILVADFDANLIDVYSVNGKNLRSLCVHEEPGVRNPSGFAITPDGFLIVVENLGERMSIWSPDDKCIRRWGCYGNHPGQFSKPWHVAILPNNLIAVTDTRNDRIQIF
jgi:DNA-binding beta-propeller fold protein YncE